VFVKAKALVKYLYKGFGYRVKEVVTPPGINSSQ